MRSILPILLLVLISLARAQQSRAEIVNVQSILATESEEGLSGALQGTVDWRTGNAAFIFLGFTPIARYRSGDHLWVGIVRAEKKSNQGNDLVSRHFEHLRYRNSLSDRLMGEFFLQHAFDGIRRLESRSIVGLGPRVVVYDTDAIETALGVSYMLEYERIKNDDLSDGGNTDLAHRASSYATLALNIDERLQWIETFYVQPKLATPSDLRLLSESQLTFKITKALSLTTAFTLAYDSRLPESIKNLDTSLQTRFMYNF